MVSKQTKAHRLNDVARLRLKASGAPIVIDVNQETGIYSVAFTNDPNYALIRGRFQVVAAYIDGFVRGQINHQTRGDAEAIAALNTAIDWIDNNASHGSEVVDLIMSLRRVALRYA